jgi:hypothetical protein
MSQRELLIKKCLFALLLGFLFLPLVQKKVKLLKEKELKGAIVKTPEPFFSGSTWLDGKYQDTSIAWQNENFGFRTMAVRMRNQIYFELTHKVLSKKSVVSSDNYFFEQNYIDAFTGKDFIGEQAIITIAARFKRVQDELAKRNVTMVLAIAPSKASFFSEIIEAEYGKAGVSTNYLVMSRELKQQGVNFIDYNEWFVKMKQKSNYPLFTKGGVHWSNYGGTLATDSMIKFIEAKSGRDLPSLKIKNITMSDSLREPDDDIEAAANLMWPLNENKAAYPEYEYESSEGKWMPAMYVVGDSYFWQMCNLKIQPNVFQSLTFNYYNISIYDWAKRISPETGNPRALPISLNENKVFFFLTSAANLKDFPWDFLDRIEMDLGISESHVEKEKRILSVIERIKSTPDWLKSVREKAKANGKTTEEMIRLDAEWMVNDQIQKERVK